MNREPDHHTERQRREVRNDGPAPRRPYLFLLEIYHGEREWSGPNSYWENYLTVNMSSEDEPFLHPAYRQFVCPACNTLNKEALLEHGFEEGPIVCVGDGVEILRTPDGFVCINTRVKDLLESHRVTGYQTTPIPSSDWHVLRITNKLACADPPDCTPCRQCGARSGPGWSELEEVSSPVDDNTLFTSALEYYCGGFDIRQLAQRVYMTESVGRILEAAKVRAGFLSRILSREEWHALSECVAGCGVVPPTFAILLYGEQERG
jgi:hypothetical protein